MRLALFAWGTPTLEMTKQFAHLQTDDLSAAHDGLSLLSLRL
jgi:hypothetical protein